MPAPVRLDTSPRLQRVLAVLSDGEPHTTLEISLAAHVVAVDTAVRELRGGPNWLPIHRTQRGHIHSYQLAPVARLQVLVRQAAALGSAGILPATGSPGVPPGVCTGAPAVPDHDAGGPNAGQRPALQGAQ